MYHVKNGSHVHDDSIRLPLKLRKAPSEAACFMHLSSGSTGAPKAVARCHDKYIAQTIGQEEGGHFEFRTAGTDVVSGRLLIPHTTGPPILTSCMYYGCTFVILNELVMEHFLSLIQRYSISHIIAVPTLVSALAQSTTDEYDVASVYSLAVFGSVLSPAVVKQFIARFPNCHLIYQMYGTRVRRTGIC